MYTLYTSPLNPKGVVAKNLLNKLSVQYKQIDIDYSDKSESRRQALSLLQSFLQLANAPLTLPFLTLSDQAEEKVVLLGFEQKEWESLFQLQPQTVPQTTAGIAQASTPFDPTHVPVVGAEQEAVQ